MIKVSRVQEGPETRVQWVSEHTEEMWRAELGCTDDERDRLHAAGAIT